MGLYFHASLTLQLCAQLNTATVEESVSQPSTLNAISGVSMLTREHASNLCRRVRLPAVFFFHFFVPERPVTDSYVYSIALLA